MTTDSNWKVQASPKTPSGTLVNVRGESAEAFKEALDIATAHAGDIASLEALLGGAANAAQGFATQTPQSAPQPQATPAPAANGKTCAHGAMVWRTGSSAKGPWGGHFCPLPKERKAEQCEPVWDRSYGK